MVYREVIVSWFTDGCLLASMEETCAQLRGPCVVSKHGFWANYRRIGDIDSLRYSPPFIVLSSRAAVICTCRIALGSGREREREREPWVLLFLSWPTQGDVRYSMQHVLKLLVPPTGCVTTDSAGRMTAFVLDAGCSKAILDPYARWKQGFPCLSGVWIRIGTLFSLSEQPSTAKRKGG